MTDTVGYAAFPHSFRHLTTRGMYGRLAASLGIVLLAAVFRYGFAIALQLIFSSALVLIVDAGIASRLDRRNTTLDALLASWLVLSLLPPALPWYVVFFAVATTLLVGKWTFGGVGSYWMHPALVGYLLVFTSFPMEITQGYRVPALWPPPSLDAVVTDFLNRVVFGRVGVAIDGGLVDLLFGNHPGPLGTSGAVLILAAGVFLLADDVVPILFPAIYMATVTALLIFFRTEEVLRVILSGQVLIVAFFLLPDPASRSKTHAGAIVAPAFCGVMTVLLMEAGLLVAAPAFGCALTNAITPLVDSIAGRAYLRGHDD